MSLYQIDEQECEAAYVITEEGAKIINCAPTNQKHWKKISLELTNHKHTIYTHYPQLVEIAMATVCLPSLQVVVHLISSTVHQ